MLSEETPPASWFEAGFELAEGKDQRVLGAFVRTTLREIRDQVPAKVAELDVFTKFDGYNREVTHMINFHPEEPHDCYRCETEQ